MKSLALTLTLLLAMLIVSGPAPAQMANQPSVTLNQTSSMTGTVVGIDRADRELTIKGPQGNIMTVDVDPSVTNFNQLSLGDKVNMNYFQSTSMAIVPGGQQCPSAQSMPAAVGQGPGENPQSFPLHTVETTAVVKSINRQTRTVTLQGPMGEVFSVQAPANMTAYDNLKVGDTIQTQYSAPTVISINKQ